MASPHQVRQLEAIVRIAESVAKMRLSPVATEDDVQTAIHMFTVSTLRAAKMGDIEIEGVSEGAERTAEEHIRKRVQIMMAVNVSKLLGDLNDQGIDRAVAQRALNAMVRQGDFQEVAMGKKVKRLRRVRAPWRAPERRRGRGGTRKTQPEWRKRIYGTRSGGAPPAVWPTRRASQRRRVDHLVDHEAVAVSGLRRDVTRAQYWVSVGASPS